MSRIGKKPITIPQNVTANLTGEKIEIKGPNGSREFQTSKEVNVTVDNNLITVKPKMDDSSYQKLKSIYDRTLLAARLRSAISAVYYGSRIESKNPNLQKLINKNKTEAERIIKEIENYASRYPIGEYDWKKDAELAKSYKNLSFGNKSD